MWMFWLVSCLGFVIKFTFFMSSSIITVCVHACVPNVLQVDREKKERDQFSQFSLLFWSVKETIMQKYTIALVPGLGIKF